MNLPLLDLNIIIIFLVFAKYSLSYSVYVIDTKGNLAKVNEPIHIDAEDTPKLMRDRFAKEIAQFLMTKEDTNKKIRHKNLLNLSDLRNYYKRRPNDINEGGFIQKYGIKNKRNSAGISKNYYDYSIAKRLLRSRDDANNLGDNPLSLNSSEYITIMRNGKKTRVNRFKIVANSSEKKRKKNKNVSSYSDSDNSDSNSDSSEEVLQTNKPQSSYDNDASVSHEVISNSLSEEKIDSSETSGNEADDVYLQGNQIVPSKGDRYDNRDDDDDDYFDRTKRGRWDGRRRLPHFMPKRYHWNPKELKHLGYFWFNGPKGKYPEAIPL